MICDPTRMMSYAAEKTKLSLQSRIKQKGKTIDQKECIVYVSGGRDIEFANHLLDYLIARKFEQNIDREKEDILGCEVHVFAPSLQVSLFA